MSKFEEAINYFDGYGSPYDDLLIELLERATPLRADGMKTEVKALDVETEEVMTFECTPCPKCTKWLIKVKNYCPNCGQRIEE